jgi:hypothetical protein
MKVVICVLMFCIVSSSSFAAEVKTDCLAMNEGREKNVKTIKPLSKSKKGSSQQ